MIEMKTICIFSYKRTGSNWLCDTFSGQDSISLYEPFSKDPLAFFYTLFFLLKDVYKVDNEILDAYVKIYNYSNFFIDPSSYTKLMHRILEKKPYSIGLLKTIQNKFYQIEKNMVFKIFPEQIEDDISLEKITNLSDYIIINYRNNLLESFISEQKSLISHKWASIQTERKYLEKIEWNEYAYTQYVKNVIASLNYLIKNINKEYVMLSYENIHKSINKTDYICNTIKKIYPNFKWNFKQQSVFSKENYITNIEDNFLNKEEFLKSINNIQTKIYDS